MPKLPILKLREVLSNMGSRLPSLVGGKRQSDIPLIRPQMVHRFESITDPIAVDRWECKRDGQTFMALVQIGRPIQIQGDQNEDWCCPVFVETFTPRVVTVMGVGPIDALLNATLLIRRFAEELEEWVPRAGENSS